MTIPEQAAAIINNVLSGLIGITNNCPISQEQVEEEVIIERNQVIKEYLAKQIIQPSVIAQTIHNLKVDMKKLSKNEFPTKEALNHHIEIPKLFLDLQKDTVLYIGTPDKHDPYMVYLDWSFSYHNFRIRGANKPYVFIDPTPNENDALDVFIFNDNPDQVTITAIFQDPREAAYANMRLFKESDYKEFNDNSFIANDVIRRLSEKYFRHYVQPRLPVTPNTQQPGL